MADGAHTRQMTRQEMVQQLDEMRFLYEKLNYERKQHCLQEIIASLESSWNSQIHIQEFNSLPSNTVTVYPEPSKETMKNIEPETMKKYDPFIEPLKDDSALQVLDSVPDVLMVHKVDSHVKEVEESSQQSTNGNDKIVVHQVFDVLPNEYQKETLTKSEADPDPLPTITLISSPPPIKPPDPPDYKTKPTSKTSTKKKIPLRYSGEEIYERMEKGFCIFCEDLDTPGHYNLKHKRSKLCLVESVGDESPDDDKPCEVTVEEIANKSVDMNREEESNSENESRPEFSHQVLLSQVQHTPTNQYRAPFNPCQNHSDKPHNKSKFGNCIGHEIEFDREGDEIEDDELQDKQIEQIVETLVMNEGEQPLDTTRHNNLPNEMATSLGLVGGDDQEDNTKFARKKNNSETKIEFSSSDPSCFVALVTTSNSVKRECREIVLTDNGDRAWALELRFNQVGNGEIRVFNLCPAEKASKESFPVEVMHWINKKNEAEYSPNEKIVYTLTSGLCQAKRDHEEIRVLEKLIQPEFSLDLLDCSSLTGLFCKLKLEVEVTVLLEGNMNIKRATFFGRNVVKWKCWLVVESRLPLHYWVAWRKLIVWEVLCILQNNAHRLVLFIIIEALTLFNDQHTLVAEKNGTETSIVLKLIFGTSQNDVDEAVGCVRHIVKVFSTESQFNFQRSHEHHIYVTMLKQWVLQVVSQQRKQGTGKLWVLNEPMIGTSFSLMKNIESPEEHEQLEDAAKGIRSYESYIGHVEKSLTEFSVYGVFHLQRPPELGQSKTVWSRALPSFLLIILEDKDVLKREVL